MEMFDFLLHIDAHLREAVVAHGVWVYAMLFAIVFSETGFVVTPFLPGDSLLFAVGALAADHLLDVNLAALVLFSAAVLGNTVNYNIGRWLGPKVFHYEDSRWFRRDHLQRAHAFFEKHGGKAVVFSRFIPIVRTFVPFVAGVGTMDAWRYAYYNVLGATAWVAAFVGAGFLLGNVPVVKENLEYLVFLIIVVSVAPVIWGAWQARRAG
jgi:membrane-associated protein